MHLPQRGGGGGAIILNPSPAETAEFVQLRPGDGVPGSVGACTTIAAPGARRICGPTLLDTGAPGLLFRGTPQPPRWRDGQPASLTLYAAAGGGGPTTKFRIGDKANGADARFRPEFTGGLALNAGTLPFYAYDILFDRMINAIAVRPNRSARGGVRPSIN